MFDTTEFIFWSLIFMRVTGFIVINPIFGRSGVPPLSKGGMVFALTLLIGMVERSKEVFTPGTTIEYALLLLSEFLIGIGVSYVISLIMYVISFAGAFIDFQMGISMANVYDPQTRSQIALTGSIYQAFFFLLFFAMDGHLMLMKLLVTSGSLVPYGHAVFSAATAETAWNLFIQCTVLAIQFSFPVIVIELLANIAVGILMKAIPQVNIFVINIQIKVCVGFLLLFLMCFPVGEFLKELVPTMQRMIEEFMMSMH